MIPATNSTNPSKYYITNNKNNVLYEHEIVHNNKSTEPDVVICTTKNHKTGEIEQQTLPINLVNKMYSIASNKAASILLRLLCFGSVALADVNSRYNAIDYSRSFEEEYIINADNNNLDGIEFSEDISNELGSIGNHGKRFIFSLVKNKESLMKDLNLNDKQYDDLADIALKISKNESQFGKSLKYRGFMVTESYLAGAYGASKIREYKSTDKDPTLSRGMTQYKIAFANDNEKALFDKYGITYNNLTTNIQYPEKSAVATIIHLGSIQKGYEAYLEKMDEISPDLSNPEVQESIENAKSIIFNDELRPKAIKALTRKNGSGDESEYLKVANLTQKDLEDLRTYAKSIRLSEKAFVAAGWPGKNIRPYGKSADLGCANLINAAAGVGYIANIADDIKLPE